MDIDGGVEVGMALVVARGAKEEFAPTAIDPLTRHQAEPQPFGSTTGAILRRAMRIDFDTDHRCRIGFLFRELVDLASQLIGLLAVEPPGFAPSLWFDDPQAFKEQHTARILLADLNDGSCGLVSHIRVLPADMPPELLIAVFPFDRLARLPLLLRDAPQMAIAVLIKPVVRDKAGVDNPAMLPGRNHGELLHIQVDGDRDQVGVALAFHDPFGGDGLALHHVHDCRVLPQDELRAFLLPSFLTSMPFKVAVVAGGVVDPDPVRPSVHFEARHPLSRRSNASSSSAKVPLYNVG